MSDLLSQQKSTRATVDAKMFASALKKVAAVLKKSCIPALEQVCVRFSNGQCVLTATDLETYLTAQIAASGSDFAFVFSRTRDVERACRYFEGELALELTETGEKPHWLTVRLSCGPRAAEFDAYSAEDYPDTPNAEGAALFTANAASLLERIKRVSYATRKPGLSAKDTACCVEFMDDRIYALDGVRAAWDSDPSIMFSQPFLIYAAPLSYLKVFGDQTVQFHRSGRYLRVSGGNLTAMFRVSEAEPYKLESAIPAKFAEEFLISPKEFLAELTYLKNVTPPTGTPYVYLCGNELSMPVKGKSYRTAANLERKDGLTVGFNLHYLIDAIKQFGKEKQVRVKISGANTPVVIEAEGRSDRAMLLPVRVKQNAAA